MSSKFTVFKESVISFFTRQTFKRLYERVRYKNMSRRQRITFIVLMTLLPSMAILLGILLSCIYGIDYHSIAIGVNQSTQRLLGQQTYHNEVRFFSPVTSLKKFPNGYFQIFFSDNANEAEGLTRFPSIPVRTTEGTPLKIDLFVKGRLNTANYTAFYMKYGDDWMLYLRQKIPNAIIRAVSTKGFYDLSNQVVRQEAGSVLASFDQFIIDIVSVGIQLPKQHLSNVDGTIGWSVFQKQAELILLQQSNSLLNSYITNNDLETDFRTYGALKARKDKLIIDNSISIISDANTSNYWAQGMNRLAVLVPNTTANYTIARREILWYYFQSYYNSSFNSQPHQIQFS